MVSWDQADLTVGDPEPSLMSHDAGDELSRAVQSDHEVVDSWQEWFYGDAGPRTPVSAGHSVGLSATNVALPSALTAEEPSQDPSGYEPNRLSPTPSAHPSPRQLPTSSLGGRVASLIGRFSASGSTPEVEATSSPTSTVKQQLQQQRDEITKLSRHLQLVVEANKR